MSDELKYMFDHQLPFVQSRHKWVPTQTKDGKWVVIPRAWADVVWDITVTGPATAITLTSGRGEQLFSWQRGESDVTTVKLDVSVSLLKLGMSHVALEITSPEEPEIHAIHVLYNDNNARRYEAYHNVMKGYSARSELWDNGRWSLASPPAMTAFFELPPS